MTLRNFIKCYWILFDVNTMWSSFPPLLLRYEIRERVFIFISFYDLPGLFTRACVWAYTRGNTYFFFFFFFVNKVISFEEEVISFEFFHRLQTCPEQNYELPRLFPKIGSFRYH